MDCHAVESRKSAWEFVESRQRVPARENSVRKGSDILWNSKITITVLLTVP